MTVRVPPGTPKETPVSQKTYGGFFLLSGLLYFESAVFLSLSPPQKGLTAFVDAVSPS